MLNLNATVDDVIKYRKRLSKPQTRVFDALVRPNSFLYGDAEIADQADTDVKVVKALMSDSEFMAAVNVGAEEGVANQLYRVRQAQAFFATLEGNSKDREQYLKRYDPTDEDKNGGNGVTIINDFGD